MRLSAFVSMMFAPAVVAASALALAQEAAPPARETPPSEDLEPRVNTSVPADANDPAPRDAGAEGAAAAQPSPRGKAVDRLELDTTQITGNRELPKVLYIVPWKRSDLGDLVGKPINSLLDEVLTPVDRDVFQRENRYYRALTPGAVENDALSAPDSRPATPTRSPVPTNSAPAAGMPGSATHPNNAAAGGTSPAGDSATPPRRDEK